MQHFIVNRRWLVGVAALAMVTAFSASTVVHAGESSKSKVSVRLKSFRSSTVGVGVANTNPTITRSLSPGQVTQYKVNKGTFTVRADSATATYNSGKRKVVYIAITDTGIEDTTTRF